MNPTVRRRRGMIIPLVMIALIVMALLGTWLMWSSTSHYQQTGKVAASVKCAEVLAAAAEEARAIIYDRLNRPVAGGQPPWHAELQPKLTGTPGTGVLVTHDLRAERLLRHTAVIASAMSCEVTSAAVELCGFKRLSVESRGLFEDPKIYYRDPDGVLDPSPDTKLAPPREWIGYARLKVGVRFGGYSGYARTLVSTFDVKVVDVAPPAREFTLFSFLSTERGLPGGPGTADYANNDLRRGGPMWLFSRGQGRVFVRGPFQVDTVGYVNGTGGMDPRSQTSSMPNSTWHGWATIPAVRDGMVCRSGPAIVNFGAPPMRPDDPSDWRAVVGLVTQRAGSAFADWFNDDPGYYILDGQRWFSGSVWGDANEFSICGKAGNFQPFRGVLAVYRGSSRTEVQVPPRDLVQPNRIGDPYPQEKRWVLEPEGALLGVYNTTSYSGNTYARGFYERYRLTQRGQTVGKLGLHWEMRYEQGWWAAFAGDLFLGIIGFNSIAAWLIPRSVTEGLTVALFALFGADARPNRLTELNVTSDTLRNALPPGYRPPNRAVTRRYRKLAELPSQQPGRRRTLVLDGVLGFDDLSTTDALEYTGWGVLYSDAPSAPTMVAPITPREPGTDGTTPSWLTLHHEGPVRDAYAGRNMLNVRCPGAQNTVVATVYATQGVKPSGNLLLRGNMVCGYPNKGQIPGGSSVSLEYRAPPAGPKLISAISFRTSSVVVK